MLQAAKVADHIEAVALVRELLAIGRDQVSCMHLSTSGQERIVRQIHAKRVYFPRLRKPGQFRLPARDIQEQLSRLQCQEVQEPHVEGIALRDVAGLTVERFIAKLALLKGARLVQAHLANEISASGGGRVIIAARDYTLPWRGGTVSFWF